MVQFTSLLVKFAFLMVEFAFVMVKFACLMVKFTFLMDSSEEISYLNKFNGGRMYLRWATQNVIKHLSLP